MKNNLEKTSLEWTTEGEEAIIEEAVVIIATIADVDAAEVEGEDTATNLTITIDLAIMAVEAEGDPAIDSVPVHSPNKIHKRPCSARSILS